MPFNQHGVLVLASICRITGFCTSVFLGLDLIFPLCPSILEISPTSPLTDSWITLLIPLSLVFLMTSCISLTLFQRITISRSSPERLSSITSPSEFESVLVLHRPWMPKYILKAYSHFQWLSRVVASLRAPSWVLSRHLKLIAYP